MDKDQRIAIYEAAIKRVDEADSSLLGPDLPDEIVRAVRRAAVEAAVIVLEEYERLNHS